MTVAASNALGPVVASSVPPPPEPNPPPPTPTPPPPVGGAPASTSQPMIQGTMAEGHTLSCSTGTWTNSPTSFAYQWQRDGAGDHAFVDIAAASASTYLLVAADIGCNVRCKVTASN